MFGKEAAHGFRNLSVIKIPPGFEHAITKLKTKIDEIMNKTVYFYRKQGGKICRPENSYICTPGKVRVTLKRSPST